MLQIYKEGSRFLIGSPRRFDKIFHLTMLTEAPSPKHSGEIRCNILETK